MLEVVRRHPEGIRAVILDSPLPPDANWDETSVGNYWRSMQNLFARAREDPVASRSYPDLEPRFLKLLNQAAAEPLEAKVRHPVTQEFVTVRLNHEGIFRSLANYIGTGANLSSFARTVDLLCEKNPFVLAKLVKDLVAPPPYSWGMRYSFLRNEELPFEDRARIGRHEDLPAPLDTLAWPMEPPELMEIWPGRAPDPVENKPVAGDVPALVASGQFDGDTPPAWGRQVAASLGNAFLIEFPGQSHLPLFHHPCGKPIARAFLADPTNRPSEDCLRKSEPFSFSR
jgi:pimeloyl-ACP methyl ester carboxylesterase